LSDCADLDTVLLCALLQLDQRLKLNHVALQDAVVRSRVTRIAEQIEIVGFEPQGEITRNNLENDERSEQYNGAGQTEISRSVTSVERNIHFTCAWNMVAR
jgi:hypothetical protein